MVPTVWLGFHNEGPPGMMGCGSENAFSIMQAWRTVHEKFRARRWENEPLGRTPEDAAWNSLEEAQLVILITD